MLSKNNVYVLASLFGCWSYAFLSGCDKSDRKSDEDVVVSYQCSKRDITNYVVAFGQVQSATSNTVRAEINGNVQEILIKQGDQISEGQILAVIFNENQKRLVAELREKLSMAKNDIGIRELELSQKSDQIERSIAELEKRNAIHECEIASQRYEAAQSALGRLRVASPFAGRVVAIDVQVGSPVMGQVGSQGTPIARLISTDEYKIEVHLNESDLENVSEVSQVQVTFAAIPGLVMPGRIVTISEAAAQMKRSPSYPVTVRFSSTDRRLRLGQTAEVRVKANERKGVLSVPLSCVRYDGAQPWVNLLIGDGAARRDVNLGIDDGSFAEITGGLHEGDIVTAIGNPEI